MDFNVVWYSATNNGLHSNNLFSFEGNTVKVNRRGENNLSAVENKSLKSQYSGYKFYKARYAPNQHVGGKLPPIDIPVYGFSELAVFQWNVIIRKSLDSVASIFNIL
jgi:hypothetical protein